MNIKIIPAIDVVDGKCVRLSQGDYARSKVYDENPLDMAKRFEDCGVTMLHLVDLDGAKAEFPENQRVLEDIASHTSLNVEFGGGLKDRQALISVFNAGACRAVCGSIACTKPEIFAGWLGEFGGERIILGADLKDGHVAVNGWKDETQRDLTGFLQDYVAQGVNMVICTDISCDGMLQGPSLPLYKEILEQHPNLYLIASGGVGSLDDLYALDEAGVPAVIFGKALYEGRISLADLERLASSAGK